MTVQKDIYGKVVDGQVVEYPVTVEVIKARGHRVFDYSPVEIISEPRYDSYYQKLIRDIKVVNGVIRITHAVIELSLSEIMAKFKKADGSVMKIGDLNEVVLNRVTALVSNYIVTKISYLATLRGYDNIDTMLGRYSRSSIPTFKAEVNYIQAILDQAWLTLPAYYQEIQEGKRDLPTSLAEIDQVVQIPMDWSAFPA